MGKMETKTQRPISFLLKELITCGAVLSTFELVEALRELGHEANIVSDYNNPELEDYFGITPIKRSSKDAITIAVHPMCCADYAYVRTKDGRWQWHKTKNGRKAKKIAVSDWIADWLTDIGHEPIATIGNGTHRRFRDLKIKRDIDVLVEGNYEYNKNINDTINEARRYSPNGRIVWFGRQTKPFVGVETIESPPLQEIPRLYNRAKKFLKMSLEEGWGRPVAEAKKCGVPKIINHSGGNKNVKIVSWKSIAKELVNTIL